MESYLEVGSLQMQSRDPLWIRVTLLTGETEIHTHRERPREDAGRGWRDAVTSHECLGLPGATRSQERGGPGQLLPADTPISDL